VPRRARLPDANRRRRPLPLWGRIHPASSDSALLNRSASSGRSRPRMLRTERRSAGTRSFASSKSARFAHWSGGRRRGTESASPQTTRGDDMTTEATITMTFTGLTDSDAVRRQTRANAVAVTVNRVQRWTEAVEGAARARAAGHPTADPYNAVAAFLSDESGPRSSTGRSRSRFCRSVQREGRRR